MSNAVKLAAHLNCVECAGGNESTERLLTMQVCYARQSCLGFDSLFFIPPNLKLSHKVTFSKDTPNNHITGKSLAHIPHLTA